MLSYLWPFGSTPAAKALPKDPTSQANWQDVASTHICFQWSIDFDLKMIGGSVTHTMRVNKDKLTSVVFDTADLEVSKVEVNDDPAGVPFTFGKRDPVMGSALSIPLPKSAAKDDTLKITIMYNTTPDCKALGWLTKEQTVGKSFPYLFSQCEPIYMRTLAPIQDTPSIKATYSASVSSVLPALMSALRISPPVDGPPHDGKEIGKDRVTYVYNQPIAVQSYLIAIAAGNVRYKQFPDNVDNWTSGVWTEPEMLDDAYHEFCEDTPKFMKKEESIVGPYRFKVYDLLVLPPAFPYGGMENCCLTFVTPAIVVGDRALVDVVVHELTHSWFGNGVTHANSSHFWLNEGWTVYMERVLQEKIHCPAQRGFSYIIGRKELDDALADFIKRGQPKYTRLVIPFDVGEDPDDAYSVVPYEKGSNFLLHIERTLGGLDVFLPYVKNYVETFTDKSITTDTWKDHLFLYFSKDAEKTKALNTIDWNAWLNGEGLALPVDVKYDDTLAKPAYELACKWNKSRGLDPNDLFNGDDIKGFESNQTTVFLQTMQTYKPFARVHIDALASIYGVAESPNVEISWPFHQLAISDPTSDAAKAWLQPTLDWVIGKSDGIVKGRMKYNRPIFQAAAQVNYDLTVRTYLDNKQVFHPIAQAMIEKDLGLTCGVSR